MCATHTYLLFAKRNSATQTQVLLEHKGKNTVRKIIHVVTYMYSCDEFLPENQALSNSLLNV